MLSFKRNIRYIYSIIRTIIVQFKFGLFTANDLNIGDYSLLLRSKIKVKGIGNVILINKRNTLRSLFIEICGSNNKVFFDDCVKFYEGGHILIEGDNCEITLGKNTTIGSAKLFCGESDTKIIIGDDCMLSRDIAIDTSDFHSIIDLNSNKRINSPRDVFIGEHVWIGNGAYIGKGSTINRNSVIATRTLISGKEYPADALLAGLPARVIKRDIGWSREKLSR